MPDESQTLPIRLDLQPVYQPNNYTCVPACLKMILDYIRPTLDMEENIPIFEVEQIADIVETKEDGTSFEDVRNLNKEILKANPSVEFATRRQSNIKEIIEEINHRRPIIVGIAIEESGVYNHSVVITGIDMGNQLIYYNDPIYGEREEGLGSFMSKWERFDNYIIKLKLGERQQRKLEEWMNNR